jgi:hypothetical protein
MPADAPDPHRPEPPLEPDLSPEANRLLDAELRDIAGPGGTAPDHTARRPTPHRTTHGAWPVSFADSRLLVTIVLALAVAVGAVVSLIVGTWWILLVAAVLAGLGTLLVAGVTLRSTTETERASPALAERLEDEGVTDPDRLLTDLAAETHPAEAAQQDEVTPSRRSRPVDEAGGPPD